MPRSRAKKKKARSTSWLQDNRIVRYLRGTRAELRNVHWPSRQEAENLTKVVLGVTVGMAVVMGLLDYLFSLELQGLIGGDAIAVGVAVVTAVASVVAAVIWSRRPA